MSNEVKVFSVKEIGSWQNGSGASNAVSLPSIQRGFVWDAERIETLWDSLLRGYPIGSFLMTTTKGEQQYQLLDGQQRATAIAIGMFNPWTMTEGNFWRIKSCPVLWLDINTETEDHRFKVVSHSQPWGYDKKSEKLTGKDRREAFDAIVEPKVASGYEGKYYELDLKECWPWKTSVPIPISFFFESDVDLTSPLTGKEMMLVKCRNRLDFISGFSGAKTKNVYHKAIEKFFGEKNPISDLLLESVARIGEYKVPAIVVSQKIVVSGGSTGSWGGDNPNSTDDDDADNESQQLLFQRINSQGVVPSSEELVFSIFKSFLPTADRIGEKCDYIKPSRVLQYAIRIVIADNKRNSKDFPVAPKIRDFKEWLDKDDNKKKLESLVLNVDKDDSPFKLARLLLNGDKSVSESWRLSFYQTCEIASDCQDAFFILLYRLKNGDVFDNESSQKRVLGFLTSLCWFTNKNLRTGLTNASKSIWSHRSEKQASFWSANTLNSACTYKNANSSFALVPPCPPDKVEKFINRLIELEYSFSDLDEYSNLDKFFKSQRFHGFYRKYFENDNKQSDEISENAPLSNIAMVQFFRILRMSDGLLEYACRHACRAWFDNYCEQNLEDTVRPWDRDHIYAREYVNRKVMRTKEKGLYFVKDWHSTIANFRLWPLELNRSDSFQLPGEKLRFADNKERFLSCGIENEKQLFERSGISWLDAEIWHGLGNDPKDSKQSQSIVVALSRRMLFMYKEWYEVLNLGELYPEI